MPSINKFTHICRKKKPQNTTKTEQNTTVLYVGLAGTSNISIKCNYRSCKDKLTNPTYINQWYPSAFSCVIRTLSVSNKTWQNHCGSCANLISLIADMRLSRTEWAKQRGSKRSVRKRKQDNEFKKEITRSKRGMHTQGAGKLQEYHLDAEKGGKRGNGNKDGGKN